MNSTYRLQPTRVIGLLCMLVTGIFLLLSAHRSRNVPSDATALSYLESDPYLEGRSEDFLDSNLTDRAVLPYEDSIQKGRDFMCAMEQSPTANPRFVKQSSWTSLSQLPTYGWHLGLDFGIAGIFGLEAAFAALGIPSDPNTWRTINEVHSIETKQDNTVYPATFANFVTLLNGRTPSLIAKMSYGPAWKAEKMGIPIGGNKQLPPLQRWSDLIWLAWTRVTSLQDGSADQRLLNIRASLEHIFRYQVSNEDTMNIVRRAHGGGTISNPTEIPPAWPGWEFTPDTDLDAFKSILSAPNVYGVVYLLASHKGDDQLHVKTIDRIHAFDCPITIAGKTDSRWCLYLHVAPVDATGGEEGQS